jgi:hypothetical protein
MYSYPLRGLTHVELAYPGLGVDHIRHEPDHTTAATLQHNNVLNCNLTKSEETTLLIKYGADATDREASCSL